MGIDFSHERWDRVKDTYERWWQGKLKRPVCGVTVVNRDPGRDEPPAPLLTRATCHDFSWTAEQLVDRIDYELSRLTFLGDAFPHVNLSVLGPGVMAAFIGARIDNHTGHVWFQPPDSKPITELSFQYDPENRWFRRIKDICHAAVDRWGGQVCVGMTDLGGNLDILQSFLPGEKLLFDLMDNPDDVKRLVCEIHDLWYRYFCEIHEILQPSGMGYSDWSGIWSSVPFYTLQSDISHMIGADMFDDFVKPELELMIEKLDRSIYHLDGVGQLNHLDSILEIEKLNGVQWIPGAGKPGWGEWPHVYRKIAGSGKLIQSLGSPFDEMIKIVMQTGAPGKIQHYTLTLEPADINEPEIVDGGYVKIPYKLLMTVKFFFSAFRPLMFILRIVSFFTSGKEKERPLSTHKVE